jgi:hypothetical protein
MIKCEDLASITLFTSWKIWEERNAQSLSQHAPHLFILGPGDKIKCKKLWVIAG